MGNGLALLAMTRANESVGPLREKLANYVASPPAGQFTYFVNYIENLVAMIALGEYDASRGSTDPDIELTVVSGELAIMQVGGCFSLHSSSVPFPPPFSSRCCLAICGLICILYVHSFLMFALFGSFSFLTLRRFALFVKHVIYIAQCDLRSHLVRRNCPPMSDSLLQFDVPNGTQSR